MTSSPHDAPDPTLRMSAAGASSSEPATPAPPMTEPLLGADNYRIGPEIARGGMGSVLRAEDAKLGRTVAIKVMHLDANADASMHQRFLREAEVLAQLAHPNIVPIHDIVWENGVPLFYSMKLVKGRTLQAILHDLRLASPEARRASTLDRLLLIFRKVCDAIAFAHSKGILHRDLKPENIMVGEFGEVLVMDWGLAKIMRKAEIGMRNKGAAPPEEHSAFRTPLSEFTGTMAGAVMGTPQYMSPEQALGQIDDLDARSDVFSLGGILYAILTLRPPVEGATLEEVLQKVSHAQITSPSDYQAGTHAEGKGTKKGDVLEAKLIRPLPHIAGGRVPAALSSVAMTALQLDKAQRYQSVAELSADIEAYQSGFATKAEHAGLAKQLVLLIKRHRGMFATAAAAWLVITALAVWFVVHLRAKERRAVAGESAARASEAVAVQEKEVARRSQAQSALNLADAALREGDGPQMQAALREVPEELRDSTWRYLLAESDTSLGRLRIADAAITGVAAHPQQPGVFVFADENRKITVLNVRTSVILAQFTAEFSSAKKRTGVCLAVSPDGERVAIGRHEDEGGIVIHRTQDGTKLAAWSAPSAESLTFSPDGTLLLLTHGDGTRHALHVWDSASGELRWKYEPASNYAHGAFTADGQQMLTAGNPDGLRLVNSRDGTLVRQIGTDRTGKHGLALGPGGVFALVGDGSVTLAELPDGLVLTRFAGVGGRSLKKPTLAAWTPDGGQLVIAWRASDGRQVIQLRNPRTGGVERTLLGGGGQLDDLVLHPLSGELVACGRERGATRAWSLTGAPAKWTLAVTDVPTISFFGSDDLVFAGSPSKAMAVQKLATTKLAPLWKVPDKGFRFPNVSADGRIAAIPSDTSLLVLRRDGERIEQVGNFPIKLSASRVRLSPDGARLVASSQTGQPRQFTTADGGKLPPLDATDVKSFWAIAWLLGGQRLVGLATCREPRLQPNSEERAILWDSATGQIVQTATNRTAMDVLAVAPDGRTFAEAGADKKVRLRDAATLAVQTEFRAHDGAITALAWHPTRPILATASEDLSIRLWDLTTGQRLEEFHGPRTPARALAFSPSGHRLGCATEKDATRIWEPESLQ